MPDTSTLTVFVAAALAFLLVPGPAVLYIVARSVDQGRAAGFASVLGIGLGGMVHAAFAVVGLSAILASSAAAFAIVKWLGVAYLIWLGIRRLLGSDEEDVPGAGEPDRLSRIFWQGIVVNVLNPKTALFFLAFLPQFVDTSRGPVWTQVLVLGFTLVTLGLCMDGLYALLSGTAGDWLRRKNESSGFRRGKRYVSGGVYLALGTVAAAPGSGKD